MWGSTPLLVIGQGPLGFRPKRCDWGMRLRPRDRRLAFEWHSLLDCCHWQRLQRCFFCNDVLRLRDGRRRCSASVAPDNVNFIYRLGNGRQRACCRLRRPSQTRRVQLHDSWIQLNMTTTLCCPFFVLLSLDASLFRPSFEVHVRATVRVLHIARRRWQKPVVGTSVTIAAAWAQRNLLTLALELCCA